MFTFLDESSSLVKKLTKEGTLKTLETHNFNSPLSSEMKWRIS